MTARRWLVLLIAAGLVGLGFEAAYIVGMVRDDDGDSSETPPETEPAEWFGLSDDDLRELSCRVFGTYYASDSVGWVDEDGDGYGWLQSDTDQIVMSWDEAVEQSIDYCRETGPPHSDDGDGDGIIDPLDPQTCFPGIPDDGPPPSGAPYCVDLAGDTEGGE